MSFLTVLASDTPMDEVSNPHEKWFSVNEALEKGINLPFALDTTNMDRDKPGVVLFVDDREDRGEIVIIRTERRRFIENVPSDLKYFSLLEWIYTENRAIKLIEYIQKHLEKSNEIEVWHIWIGSDECKSEVWKRSIKINKLLPTDFEKMFIGRHYSCITVKQEHPGPADCVKKQYIEACHTLILRKTNVTSKKQQLKFE